MEKLEQEMNAPEKMTETPSPKKTAGKKKKFRKNQVIITALAIMIAVAGYINYADSTLSTKEKADGTTADASTVLKDISSLDTDITDEVDAKLFVDMAHIAGLVAAGLHPTPIGHAHVTTTTTHKTLRGPRGGMILSDESFGKTLNSQIFPGIQGGPLMHIVAAKAVAFGEALRPRFKDYQAQVLRNTVTLGEELKNAKFNLVSGGTDNHLLLVDLTSKDITGKDAEHALDAAGITVNKNTVPFETRSPFVTSGIRIGTPALTTRGFREQDMVKVAGWIDAAIANAGNETRLAEISKEVAVFARQFPLFAW